MRVSIVRVHGHRPPTGRNSRLTLFAPKLHPTKDGVSLRQPGGQVDGQSRVLISLFNDPRSRIPVHDPLEYQGSRQPGVSGSVSGIQLHRAGEMSPRLLCRLLVVEPEALESPQQAIVRLETSSAFVARALCLGSVDLELQHGENTAYDVILDREDVSQLAVEALCPKVDTRGGIDKLRCDADSISYPLHASFHQVLHAQFPRYLLDAL